MKAIEKIIFNVLASRRSIVLPGVGTLAVERRAAVVSGRDVQAPVNKIVFFRTEKEGVQTLPGLMELMGVDPQQVQANYDQWLNEASGNDGLKIDGVGTLHQSVFMPSPELNQILNPSGVALMDGARRDGKSKEQQRGNCLTNILLIIIIFLLLVFGGIYVCNTYCGGMRFHCVSVPVQPVQSIQAEASVAPAEQIAPVEIAKNPVRCFHIVAGTFAHGENADVLIKWYKHNYPELAPEKVAYKNGKTIVSLFSTDDKSEAMQKRRSLAREHYNPDYWVCEVVVLPL